MARLGHIGAFVTTDISSGTFVGTETSNSFTTKVNALVWACLWLSQPMITVPICIHIDNIATIKIVQCIWDGNTETTLMAVARMMRAIARATKSIELIHCRGHNGDS